VRTLVVATEYPWPRNSGSRMRLDNTLEALRACGPVDLFSVVSKTRVDFAPPPPELGLGRVQHLAIDDRPPGAGDLLRGLRRPWAPFELPMRDRRIVRRELARFASAPSGTDDPGPYNLVWYFQVRSWVLGGMPVPAPCVVDIDDLEDEKILARLALPGRAGGLRRRGVTLWTKEDARRWRALHARIARKVSATVVCSELDARRSGLFGVRVVANGYPPPGHPVGRPFLSSPPVIMFQGTLRYPPNADGARFLVTDVGPRLRALVPDVQIRLVGLAPPALAALADPPLVIVTGLVPDIGAELAVADIVVIPLRYASGTRVKILEAFAHRIPVVSTAVGAEGLDVVPGRHLLVADDADGIARACFRLFADTEFRHTMVDEAQALYLDRYQSSSVQKDLGALARELAST
jgi:glycosyltransferase involved in cell wall biosynthesis